MTHRKKTAYRGWGFKDVQGLLALNDINQHLLRCSILPGWFFMMRMGEYLTTNSRNCNSKRIPIATSDIEPRCRGVATEWGPA